jgi:hypothetical protein
MKLGACFVEQLLGTASVKQRVSSTAECYSRESMIRD